MFQGKNVLVTGSARNTGLGIAQVFGRYGATVFVSGRSAEDVARVVEKLNRDASADGERYLPAAVDIARVDDVVHLFTDIQQQVGGLDVLVNNACHLGVGYHFLDMPMDFFDDVLAVNLRGYALCSQLAARQMIARDGGAIVNVGSNTASRAMAGRTAYIASKGGVESLTRAMAVELAEHHIRVNCVIPGYIYTERWDTLDEEIIRRRRMNVPLAKESSPEDIGEAAAFLASSKSGNITGASLPVSGGIDIRMVPPDCDA